MVDRQNITIITGGLRGIGRAIADVCAERGDKIWIFDVPEQHHKSVEKLPRSYSYLSCDISDALAVRDAFAQVVHDEGRIDVLVNNAGITKDGMAVRFSEKDWQAVIDVNLNGSFWCAQAAVKQMMKQRSGSIVMLSSLVASVGNSGQANYAASKAGIEALTRTLAKEYGGRGVQVNAVAPGFIQTEMTDRLPEAVKEEAVARTSCKRAGRPEEVAHLVAYLTSSDASYITGQIIHINGGMW